MANIELKNVLQEQEKAKKAFRASRRRLKELRRQVADEEVLLQNDLRWLLRLAEERINELEAQSTKKHAERCDHCGHAKHAGNCPDETMNGYACRCKSQST